MIKIKQSDTFRQWLSSLKDRQGRARILVRLERIEEGNFGDVQPVGEGVSEVRLHFGPGYRLYFLQEQDGSVVVLLAGGDKSTQAADIKKAKQLAREWRKE